MSHLLGEITKAAVMDAGWQWQDRFALRRLAQPRKRMVFLKRFNGRWILTRDSTNSVSECRFKSFSELKNRLADM